jgi:hypothetical protein
MSAERLELSTNGLKGHCSTIELRAPSGMHSIMLQSYRQLRVISDRGGFTQSSPIQKILIFKSHLKGFPS